MKTVIQNIEKVTIGHIVGGVKQESEVRLLIIESKDVGTFATCVVENDEFGTSLYEVCSVKSLDNIVDNVQQGRKVALSTWEPTLIPNVEYVAEQFEIAELLSNKPNHISLLK